MLSDWSNIQGSQKQEEYIYNTFTPHQSVVRVEMVIKTRYYLSHL